MEDPNISDLEKITPILFESMDLIRNDKTYQVRQNYRIKLNRMGYAEVMPSYDDKVPEMQLTEKGVAAYDHISENGIVKKKFCIDDMPFEPY